jgi:two-component system response regulator YesN
VKTLLRLSYVHSSAVPRNNIMLPNPIPPEARFHGPEPEHSTAPALAYVAAHLHERISVKTAAARCGMSSSVFSHAFTREHGIPFREFLLHARLKRARELLGNPMLAIADVAALSGFQDQAYFDRVFRRYLGMTPSRYRRQLPAEKS